MDSFKAHITEIVQEKLNSINCELIIVPSGMTSVYQPLDIGIFGIVKPKLEILWCAEQRNLRHTTGKTLVDNIIRFEDAYAELTKDHVKKRWKKAIKDHFIEIKNDQYESDAE